MVWHSRTYRNHIVPHDAKNICPSNMFSISIKVQERSKNTTNARRIVVFVYVFSDSHTRFYFESAPGEENKWRSADR